MKKIEIDELTEEQILNLYDDEILDLNSDIISWTKHYCEGTGRKGYLAEYYCDAARYGYFTNNSYAGECYPNNACACANLSCCVQNRNCTYGYALKYNLYNECKH